MGAPLRQDEADRLHEYVHEGEDAFKDGKTLLDNPYPCGTQAGNRWQIGWEIMARMTKHKESR